MNGFRQQPQASRKERLRELGTETKNLQMALRISQMMTQQLMQSVQTMSQDLGRALGLINELQYKIIAVQNVAKLDTAEMNRIANELRLKDFNEASDKEDAEGNFTVGDVVQQNSTVILTSKTEDPDRGIFRSRIVLSECGVPDLIKAFMDRPVGARALVNLNGVEHEIELLAVRNPPVAVPNTTEEQPSSETQADTTAAQAASTATN